MTSKKYLLNKIKQLIDLNGETINFIVDFNVKSKNNKPFYLLVVTQTDLDNDKQITYKHITEGEISGTIKSDSDSYDNYLLILKSDKPCEVEVSFNKKSIDPKPVEHFEQQEQEQEQEQEIKINYKLIGYSFIILVALFALYQMYYGYGTNTNNAILDVSNTISGPSPSGQSPSGPSPSGPSPSSIYSNSPSSSDSSPIFRRLFPK